MTQKHLILEYTAENGRITPAKCYGKVYRGQMMGSESSKRCRELRAAGYMTSHDEGKFEVFLLTEKGRQFLDLLRGKVAELEPKKEEKVEQGAMFEPVKSKFRYD